MTVRRTRAPALVTLAAIGGALTIWSPWALDRASAGAAMDQTTADWRAALPASREAAEGRALFGQYCAFCHGQNGDGFGINAPNLSVAVLDLTAPTVQARSDEEIAAILMQGGRGVGRSPVMPAWGRRLTSRQVRWLIAYVRALGTLRRLAE